MTDAEAKQILRSWPQRTSSLWSPPGGTGYWVRARPRTGNIGSPTLHAPGADIFHTQPDGLWLYLVEGSYADAICVEVCNSIQNLNDKRSRYMPSSHSLLVSASVAWLTEKIQVQHGARMTRWQAVGAFAQAPALPLTLPVRHLRVLYSLQQHHYADWKANHIPAGYEYFCRHSSLGGYNSQTMQHFLGQMSVAAQFRTQ